LSALFSKSRANDYRDRTGGGLAGLLRGDSMLIRAAVFVAMSLIFFFFLKITEKKIPRGIVPDTTDTVTVHHTK
jgi:hypothetical protein